MSNPALIDRAMSGAAGAPLSNTQKRRICQAARLAFRAQCARGLAGGEFEACINQKAGGELGFEMGEEFAKPDITAEQTRQREGHAEECGGLGEIYSFSITRRAGPNPFCIAYVKLDEGVTMLTHIVDTDLDSVRIGQRVKVRFAETEGGAPVPVFAPVEPA